MTFFMKMNQIIKRAVSNIWRNTKVNLKKGFFGALESTKYTLGLAYVGCFVGAIPVMMLVNLFGLLTTGQVYPVDLHKEVILPALFFIILGITVICWFYKELDIAVAELAEES